MLKVTEELKNQEQNQHRHTLLSYVTLPSGVVAVISGVEALR